MSKCVSFPPNADKNSRILILGSMPGVKSLEEQQYYAHPQNRFWRIMGKICGCADLKDKEYREKLKILMENGFALWDVIQFCERDGSLDSDIKNEKPNDIRGILAKYKKIRGICLNGGKAYAAFKKYFPDLIEEYECVKLPSTSPANARFGEEDLYREWKSAIEEMQRKAFFLQ